VSMCASAFWVAPHTRMWISRPCCGSWCMQTGGCVRMHVHRTDASMKGARTVFYTQVRMHARRQLRMCERRARD
jgi:hypothetical protein